MVESSGMTTYGYDNANNRTSKVITGGNNAGTTSYTYNNLNQLTIAGSDTYGYDADGSRITHTSGGNTDTYAYDFENRLVTLVKVVGGTGITTGTYNYAYDYRTRRIVRDESSASGVVTKEVFSGGTSVQEYTMSGTTPSLTVEYIRGSDYGGGVGGVLYTLRSGTSSYTHENRRGDVVAKTDATGSLTYQAAYEAFGKRTQEQGSTLDRQKANTKDEDPTGLLDEGFRYRDLDTGCFITKDPAGFVDGPNVYSYVRQNPWTHFDPEGLNTEDKYIEKGKLLDAQGHHFKAFMYGLAGVGAMLNPFDSDSGIRHVAPEISAGVAKFKSEVNVAVESGKIDPVSGGIARAGLWLGGLGVDMSFAAPNYMAAGDKAGTYNP